MEMKNNVFFKIGVVVFACLSLSACVRLLLPTSASELRSKAKTNAQFSIERDYLDVYRDVKRASACLDRSDSNSVRVTKSDLYREEKYGEIFVQANFGTYILNVQIREKGVKQAYVQVWSHNAGDEAPVKKWALGEAICAQ